MFPRWTFWSVFSKFLGPNSIQLLLKHVRRGTTYLSTFVCTLSLFQKNAIKWLKTPPQDGGLGWGWFDRPKKLFSHPIFHLGEKNKIWATLFWQHFSKISTSVVLTHTGYVFLQKCPSSEICAEANFHSTDMLYPTLETVLSKYRRKNIPKNCTRECFAPQAF